MSICLGLNGMKTTLFLCSFMVLTFTLLGCTFGSIGSLSHQRAKQTEQELEQAYESGDLTKKEYLQMRIDLERAKKGKN